MSSRRDYRVKRMFLIDAVSVAVGVCALAAGPVFRYMFGLFTVVTVCGFAFGARAGLLTLHKPLARAGVVVFSIVLWCGIASAAMIWWVNRYGE